MEMSSPLVECERVRFVISGIAVEMAASADVLPLFALHLDRTVLLVMADCKVIIIQYTSAVLMWINKGIYTTNAMTMRGAEILCNANGKYFSVSALCKLVSLL